MTLLAAFLEIAADWRSVFPQQRTFQRGVRQALGSLVCLGRRCLSRIIWTWGGQNRSWSGEYFLHARCQWQPRGFVCPILRRALDYCPGRPVGVAVDDTRLPKDRPVYLPGLLSARPLVAPFHVNIRLGLRFLQASLLVPLHRFARVGTRALPLRFEEVSRVKKPGRQAKPEDWQAYKLVVKQHNLFAEVRRHDQPRASGAGCRRRRPQDPGVGRRRPEEPRQAVAANLLRPLADRGQPPR